MPKYQKKEKPRRKRTGRVDSFDKTDIKVNNIPDKLRERQRMIDEILGDNAHK